MRNEIRETGAGEGIVGSRRRSASKRSFPNGPPIPLEPRTVDAVFADDSSAFRETREVRCDHPHIGVESNAESAAQTVDIDDQLMRSLSIQLELLNRQHREISLLLDQAGRRRVDRAAT